MVVEIAAVWIALKVLIIKYNFRTTVILKHALIRILRVHLLEVFTKSGVVYVHFQPLLQILNLLIIFILPISILIIELSLMNFLLLQVFSSGCFVWLLAFSSFCVGVVSLWTIDHRNLKFLLSRLWTSLDDWWLSYVHRVSCFLSDLAIHYVSIVIFMLVVIRLIKHLVVLVRLIV